MRIGAIAQFLGKAQGQYSGGFCVEELYWSTVDANWRRWSPVCRHSRNYPETGLDEMSKLNVSGGGTFRGDLLEADFWTVEG